MARTPNNRLLDNLQVDIEISPQLQRWMKNNAALAPRAMQLGLRAVTKEGSKQVKAQIRTDGLVKTGKYVKSVRGKTTKTVSIIGTRSRIANILENGASPHDIFPRKAKKLRFKYNGKIVSAQAVHHPGIRAHDPFDMVWRRMMNSGEVQSLFNQGIQAAIAGLENGTIS